VLDTPWRGRRIVGKRADRDLRSGRDIRLRRIWKPGRMSSFGGRRIQPDLTGDFLNFFGRLRYRTKETPRDQRRPNEQGQEAWGSHDWFSLLPGKPGHRSCPLSFLLIGSGPSCEEKSDSRSSVAPKGFKDVIYGERRILPVNPRFAQRERQISGPTGFVSVLTIVTIRKCSKNRRGLNWKGARERKRPRGCAR
jgi:hypothetical protein